MLPGVFDSTDRPVVSASSPSRRSMRPCSPKLAIGRARVGVEGVEVRAGAHEDALVGAVGPVRDAAIDAERRRSVAVGARERIEDPLLRPGGRVEREDLQLRRRGVQHAVDDDRVALDLRAVVGAAVAGPVGPGDLQTRDVGRRDQVGRGVLRVRGVGAVRAPVHACRRAAASRRGRSQRHERDRQRKRQSAEHGSG